MLFFSPLEQFQILPVIPIRLFFDLSITNGTIIFFFSFLFLSYFLFQTMVLETSLWYDIKIVDEEDDEEETVKFSYALLPIKNQNQIVLENIYVTARDLVRDNVGSAGSRYFPYVFSLFIFILISNVIGLVPYSFTITSHLILTFAMALSSFVAINYIGIQKHG